MDLAAEIIESAHEAQDGLGAVTAGEVIGAKIAGRKAVSKHVISGVSMEAATARMAFLASRRERNRWNWACR